ncbi:MAG: hypothetical protein K2P93_03990 [Alphaproteobacteria bacterium]|nr:hypothetical protein [Alphaproteobacteria bacterium]
MDKKLPHKIKNDDEVHIKVESWQWETPSRRLTWKHWLAIALLLAVGILFAFGFLIIASVLLIIGIIINIFLFLLRKIS